MRSKRRYWVKKALLLTLLVTTAWYAYGLIHANPSLLTAGRAVTWPTFITTRLEITDLMDSAINNHVAFTRNMWQSIGLEIMFTERESPAGDQLYEEFNGKVPTIEFFYAMRTLRGERFRHFTGFRVNTLLAEMLERDAYARVMPGRDDFEGGKRVLFRLKQYMQASQKLEGGIYKQLKEEYPNIAYEENELNALVTTGGVCGILMHVAAKGHYLAPAPHLTPDEDQRLLKSFHNELTVLASNPLTAYTHEFLNRRTWLTWADSLKFKGIIAGLGLLIAWSMFQIFRFDLGTILEEELDNTGITIDTLTLWKILLAHPRMVFLSVSRSHVEEKVREICLQYEHETLSSRLAEDAQQTWDAITKKATQQGSGYMNLRGWYEIASGKGKHLRKRLPSRELAYLKLVDGLARLQESAELPTEVPLDQPVLRAASTSKQRRYHHQSPKEQSLARAQSLIPKGISLDLSSWPRNELDNFALAMGYLNRFGQRHIDAFLVRKGLRAMLKQSHPFMAAVRSHSQPIICRELGVCPRRDPGEGEIKELPRLPSYLNVTIVGSGRAVRQRHRLVRSVEALGAAEATFVDARHVRLVEASATKDPAQSLIIFLRLRGSHDLRLIIEREEVPMLIIESSGTTTFQREVAEKYHQIYGSFAA